MLKAAAGLPAVAFLNIRYLFKHHLFVDNLGGLVDSFAAVIRKYVGITELTPTIANEFVKEDYRPCAGQVQRPPAAENPDYLELRRGIEAGRGRADH